MSWFEAAGRWYAVLLVATWAAAPLVRLLCGRLADRGALVARPLALLGVVYPTWLLSSVGLLPYSTLGLWVTIVAGGVVGWTIAARRRSVDRRWVGSLLVAEAVSLAAFAGYLWLRGFTPEIFGTEKPMDAAFLAASARTTTMPPPDPWFAGEPINYYYLGYLLHGAVARMAGVATTTGFNLALAATVAATATAAAGVGFDAARPWLSRRLAVCSGLLSAVLLVLVGNLFAAIRLLRQPAETLAAAWNAKGVGIGWRSSRIVCDGERIDDACVAPAAETINEFPFFSFLLGDLHPHVMALPVAVAALALALNLALRGRDAAGTAGWSALVQIGVTGAVVGSLYALNSWDFPTYLAVVGGAVVIGLGRAEVRRIAAAAGVLVAGALGAWLPFFLGFVPPTGAVVSDLPALVREVPVLPGLLASVGVHAGERTSIGEFLTIFGVPYVVAVWLIVTGLARDRRGIAWADVPRPALVGAIGVLVLAVLLPAPVLALCGLPLAGAVALMRRDGSVSARTVATGLFAVGLALALVVELVYVRDVFASRMNTLFKVYYQVWTLFAVATALALVILWREARPRLLARPSLAGFAAVALAAGAVYPALAAYRWTGEFGEWDGLDGIAYVGARDADELAAIRWLQANAREGDVLLEAAGCPYRPLGDVPFNRVSAFTGVPTVIGWDGHERQWRSGRDAWLAAIRDRGLEVADLFAEPTANLVDRYGVSLLFVGRYERESVDPFCEIAGPYSGLDEEGYPGEDWELAFERGDVLVFRRTDGGAALAAVASPSRSAGARRPLNLRRI